jgi:DNA replication protein DnaC
LIYEYPEIEKDYPMTCFGAPKRHSEFYPLRDSRDKEWTENYNNRKARIAEGGTFIFCGPRGVGKTQQAISVMGYLYKVMRKTVRYATAYDITKGVFGRYNMSKHEIDKLGAPVDYFAPTLLIIDALEILKGSDAETRELNSLIDKRYGEPSKATILITNDLPSTLGEFLGESVVDRANETGGVIVFKGRSFRGQE